MFSFIENLEINIIDNEDARLEDFKDDSIVTWDAETYRSFFKACNVKQKVEVFDAIKSMKALLINFTDETGAHYIFMPPDKSGNEFL